MNYSIMPFRRTYIQKLRTMDILLKVQKLIQKNVRR